MIDPTLALYTRGVEVVRIVNIIKLAKIASWVVVIGFTVAVFVVGAYAVIALF